MRKNILFLEFWIARLTRMREKSWSMCPLEFATFEESSFAEYIEVSKIQENTTHNIGSLDEVSIGPNSKTILETLSTVSGILSIVTHHPVGISWYEELIPLDVVREIGMSTIGRREVWLMYSDESAPSSDL